MEVEVQTQRHYAGKIDDKFKETIQNEIVNHINYDQHLSDEEIEEYIDQKVFELLGDRYYLLQEKVSLAKGIYHAIRKMDLLSSLLEDETITEIMVNGTQKVFVERYGKIQKIEERFVSEEKLMNVVQQIVAGCNRMVNETNPIVDARLESGDRVNVVLPPVSLDGPIVTIRKFPKKPFTMDRLLSLGSITEECCEDLRMFVEAGYNIFISGGTGSGKTSFLNALSEYIPQEERVITIEDSAELSITHIPNLVRLEMRNANIEGTNAITIRDLLKSSLRMRPDRIIVGEVRDAAAQDMISAMNTGHSGLSTGHANSAKDMLLRLETMILMGVDMPVLAIRQQVASALDVIIHLGRMHDHTRKVLEIVEILGMENGEIKLYPLYQYKEGLRCCGIISDREKLIRRGLEESYLRAHDQNL